MRPAEHKPAKRSVASKALTALGCGLLAIGLALPASAAAEPPEFQWDACRQLPSDDSPAAPLGQQCSGPRGVAADSANGHVFVADSGNNRIVEFNARGEFVKAWGWGVDTGAAAPETCLAASTCQAALSGTGVGQFGFLGPQGVAVDSAGNVYVVDRGLPSNQRVQKFDPDGNFVLMFGGDVNKTKVEALAPEAERNVCPVDPGDVCQKGSAGAGQGQFGEWPGGGGDWITIDAAGTPTDTDDKVYVGDFERIQRFDTGGVYQGEISLPGKSVRSLATDTTGNLYYIDKDKPGVHKISPSGTPLAPETFELPKETPSKANLPTAVAVDAAGHVYAFGIAPHETSDFHHTIFEFEPAGSLIEEIGELLSGSTGLATNLCAGSEAPGNLYVTNASFTDAFLRAYGTEPVGCFKATTLPASGVEESAATLNGTVNPSGEAVTECFFEYGITTAYGQIAQCEEPDASEIGTGATPVPVHADLSGLQAASTYHFRLVAKVGGETETAADEQFKTLGPPAVSEEHSASVTDTEATLKALINPEGLPTTYSFQYTPQASFEASGFEGAQSTPVNPVGEDREEHPAIASLTGLEPGTTYRWRILATNTAALNGGLTAGESHTLNTYEPFAPESGCPNQALRTEASAFLPDCRAYEMVSPVDKNGGDIVSDVTSSSDPGGYVQAAPGGDKLTYTAYAAFGDMPTSFRFNQYLAERTERGEPNEGWANEGINMPRASQSYDPVISFGAFRYFMAFTPDLCNAWLVDYQTPPATPQGQDGYANLYRRENCGEGAGGFEALTDVQPGPGTVDEYVDPRSVLGYSTDGSHAFFLALSQLTPEAAPGNGSQIYDRFGGALRVVSVLPDGSSGDPEPGDGMGFPAPNGSKVGGGWHSDLEGAVSEDGSHVYWTGQGGIYLRLHPEQGIVAGECTEAAKACTVPVVSAIGASFRGGAADGAKALYMEGEDLYEFDLGRYETEEEASRLIASGVIGVAGASDDLSHVYFASREALAGAGENSEGDEAIEGEPNLYLDQEGTPSFVATLSEKDVGEKEPSSTTFAYHLVPEGTYIRATRVSADGTRIAFNSRAPLTGYDNTTEDGRSAVEVFAYEAGETLDCISCNPSGARPSGARDLREPYLPSWTEGRPTEVPAAAWIPTWEHSLHASNVLSADGERLFFNSFDSLLPRDTNGQMDVYEWEAPGAGGCDIGDPDYFPQNGGCVYLISSGESSFESQFWEASPDGEDVFFTTESSLLPQDPGSIDLYDARVGGGFPQPAEKAACEGEACQSQPPAPNDPTPASTAYRGPGNEESSPNCGPTAKRAARLMRKAKRARAQAKDADERARAKRLAKQARKLSQNAKRCRRANRRAAR